MPAKELKQLERQLILYDIFQWLWKCRLKSGASILDAKESSGMSKEEFNDFMK